MWLGVDHVAQQRGANTLYLAGGHFGYDTEALLYELFEPRHVDGIVSFASFIGSRSTAEQFQAFLSRYHPLPVLNAGWIVPNVQNLSLDELGGMRDTIDHLVQVHGCRRIAYVGHYPGRLGFEDRYQAFRRVMTGYGLFEPGLVTDGLASLNEDIHERRTDGILEGFDRNGLLPGRDYEAIVASGDSDAIRCVQELQARGIRVPDDVVVTGFRDGQEAGLADPPLTTVRMPWFEVGKRAAELVLDAIDGTPLPDQTYVPMQLVIRQSCGCQDPLASSAVAGCARQGVSTRAVATGRQRKEILDEMARGLGDEAGMQERDWAARLYGSFVGEIAGQQAHDRPPPRESGFAREMNRVLHEVVAAGRDVIGCHNVVSAMRHALRPYLAEHQVCLAEDLWHESRVIIGQAAGRALEHDTWQAAQRMQVLHGIEAALLTTANVDELLDILADRLVQIGISRCYLALYEDPSNPEGWARLLLAYDKQGRIDLPRDGLRFRSRLLVPSSVLPAGSRYSLIVNALHVGEEHIGFVAFTTSLGADTREDTICETLRRQISSALKGVQLRQQAIEARERAEQADRLKSRFLSAVSHELRTPLNLLVSLAGTTEHQLSLVQGSRDDSALPKLRDSLQQIRNSAMHLDHLILDVLDLARSHIEQMRLSCVPLDLRQVLIEIAEIAQSLTQQKALDWELDIPDELPLVNGDRTRLRQVVLNLVNNAVKFSARGCVSLRALAQNGQVIVIVRDTGVGIPVEDQEIIFDEFQQSGRTVMRGHGGLGLGLAISRKLIELHDGTIGVRSSGIEGCGSTFYFTLPVLQNEEKELASAEAHTEPYVLLLAEDAVGSRQLQSHLVEQGFRMNALVPDQCEDWLAQILASPPEAIVMDAALAARRGWAMLKVLKEHPVTHDTSVLFYSLAEGQDSGSLLEIDYVAKDAAVSQLARALKRHGLVDDLCDGKPTVLIVDDEPGLLKAYTSIVQTYLPHCRVLWAQDGAEALRTIQQQVPDVILLDLIMPTVDGFEVLEAIRQGETTRNIPVIVLTGHVLAEDDIARLNQGVAAVLGKGVFSAEETAAQIEAALNRIKRLGSDAQQLVRQAMAHIHTTYAEAISCADIAQHVNVSQDHLIRCFKREVGVTPLTYLNRWRIKQARTLLETGNRSVTEIALDTGFSSQAYFSRVFKEEMGIPPSAYRRAFQQGQPLAFRA
jgi:signal transduction histidine kinase/DNA-binding LacI/PurR family transcriptional regulator/AraC-like DNA-binding protein